MNNKVIGCWIFPDGQIHMTSEIESHIQSLNEIGIKDQLLKFAEYIEWTSYEKENFYDSDLPYIAFKCGYIRIIAFNDQVGIQYLGDIRKLSSAQKNAITTFLLSTINICNIKCIVVEKFLVDSNSYSFLSLNDFLEFLN